MVFQILESEDGKVLGIIQTESVYEAARKASVLFFNKTAFPFRETGWAGHSGMFSVQNDDGSRGRRFFVRIPSTVQEKFLERGK
jgi:hypothetical protein